MPGRHRLLALAAITLVVPALLGTSATASLARLTDADTTTLGDIAVRRHTLSERARAGKLQPADIAGATFTISNLGMYHVQSFTAIIVPPQPTAYPSV